MADNYENSETAHDNTGLPLSLSQDTVSCYSPFSPEIEDEIRRLERQDYLPVIPDALRRLETIRDSVVVPPLDKPPGVREIVKSSAAAGLIIGLAAFATTRELGISMVASSTGGAMFSVRRLTDWQEYKNARIDQSEKTRRIRLARKILELRLSNNEAPGQEA